MNSNEFTQWRDYHFRAFREDREKLVKVMGDEYGDLMLDWEPILARRTLDACRAATDAMMAGEINRPFHASDIPAVINQAAAEIEAKQAVAKIGPTPGYDPTKEPRYKCLKCEDTGFAPILHPGLAKYARNGTLLVALWFRRHEIKRDGGRVVNALCICESGQRRQAAGANEDAEYSGGYRADSLSVFVLPGWFPAMKSGEFARLCEESAANCDFAAFGDPDRDLEF